MWGGIIFRDFKMRNTLPLNKQLEVVQKEINNIMKAIKAGILIETTEKGLREAETRRDQIQALLDEQSDDNRKLKRFLPRVRKRFQELVENLENFESSHLEPIRDQIKTLVGGKIRLFPTDQGYLEAEVSGDYAGFLKATAEESKIIVVAGEGFEPSTFGLCVPLQLTLPG